MNNSTVRIDHFLSTHGVCSRRAVGAFLKSNKVTVNGMKIVEPGTRIQISDNVLIKGKPVKSVKHVYFMLHKPQQIRRMCEKVKMQLISLKRIQIGPVKLGDLLKGTIEN